MKRIEYYEKELEREKGKLNRYVNKAMRLPIATNEEILEQSRKVDRLIDLIREESMKTTKREDKYSR